MEYNKNRFGKLNDKKVLHKVKKQWVVVSSALLFAIGGSGALMTQHSVHADVTNNNKATVVKNNLNQKLNRQKQTNSNANNVNLQHNVTNNNVVNQAKNLHRNILANQTTNLHSNSSVSISNNNQNNQSNYVNSINHDFKQQNDIKTNNTPKYVQSINDEFESSQKQSKNTNSKSPKVIEQPNVHNVGSTSGTYQGLNYTSNGNGTLTFTGTASSTLSDFWAPGYGAINTIFDSAHKVVFGTPETPVDFKHDNSMQNMFNDGTNPGINEIDFNNVKNMNNITNMDKMFSNNSMITKIVLGHGFDMSHVTDDAGMFDNQLTSGNSKLYITPKLQDEINSSTASNIGLSNPNVISVLPSNDETFGNYQGLNYTYNSDTSTVDFTSGTSTWQSGWGTNDFLGSGTTAPKFMENAKHIRFENGVNFPGLTTGSGNTNFRYFIANDPNVESIYMGSKLANAKVQNGTSTAVDSMFRSDYNLKSLTIPNGLFGQYDSGSDQLTSDKNLGVITILPSSISWASTYMKSTNVPNSVLKSKLSNTLSAGIYTNGTIKSGTYDGLNYIYNPNTKVAEFVNGRINWSSTTPADINAFMTDKADNYIDRYNGSILCNAKTVIFDSDVNMNNSTDINDGSDLGCDRIGMFMDDNNLHKVVFNSNFATPVPHYLCAFMFAGDYFLSDITIPQGFDDSKSDSTALSYDYGMFGDFGSYGTRMHCPIKKITITPANDNKKTMFSKTSHLIPSDFYNDNNRKVNLINNNIPVGIYTKDPKTTSANIKVHYHDIFSKDDQGIPGILKDSTLTVNKNSNSYTFNDNTFPKGWLPVDNNGHVISDFTPQSNTSIPTVNVAPAYFGLAYGYNANTQTVKFTGGKLTWNANVGAQGNWGNYDFLGGYSGGHWHNHSGSSSHYAGYTPAPLFLDQAKHVIFSDAVDTSVVDYSSNGQGGNYMYMFANNPCVQSIDLGNNFTTPEVRGYAGVDMMGMFESDKDLKEIDLSPSFGGTYDTLVDTFLSDMSLRKIRIRQPVPNPPTSGVFYTNLSRNYNTGLYSNWYAGNSSAPSNANESSTNIADGNQHTGYWYLDRDPEIWSDITEGGGTDGHGENASKITINGHTDTITVDGGSFDPGSLWVPGGNHNDEFAVHLYSQKTQQYLADDLLPNDNKDWKIQFKNDVNVSRSDASGRADWLFDGKNDDTGKPDFIGNQVSDIDFHNFDLKNAKTAQALMLNDYDLKHVEIPSDINSGNIKDWYMAFGSDYNISDLDLHNLDTSGTTGTTTNPTSTSANSSGAGKDGTRDMFNDDYDLEHLKLGGKFQLPHAKNMSEMFASDYALSDIEGLSDTLSNTHPENTFWMFGEDAGLSSLNLPDTFDTSNDVNTAMMFESDASLTNLHLGKGFNTQNVKDMDNMFLSDRSLANLEFPSDFNTINTQGHEANMLSSDDGLQNIIFDGNNVKLDANTYLPNSWYQVIDKSTNPWQTSSDTTNLLDDDARKGTWTINPNPKDATKIRFHDIYSDASTDNHGDGLEAPTKIVKGNGSYTLADNDVPTGWSLVDGNGHIIHANQVDNRTFNLDNGIHTFNVAPVYRGLTYHNDIKDKSLEFIDGTCNLSNSNGFLNVPQFYGNQRRNTNTRLKSVEFDSDVNTNNINNASDMFANDTALESLFLPNNFGENINNANGMFAGDKALESLTLPNNFGSQINTANQMFANNSALVSLTIPNNFAKSLGNHNDMFKNDRELYRVTGNNTYSDNPLDVNSNLNPTITPNNIQAGTYVDKNARKINVKFHDIYGSSDGFTVPSSNELLYTLNDNNVAITQDGVPGSQALTNAHIPNGWALVDKSGNIINTESAKVNGNTAIYNVAPVYYGLTYHYNKENKKITFINGNLTWNYSVNSNKPAFFGTWSGQLCSPNNIPLSNVKSVYFDNNINVSNVSNMSWFFSSDGLGNNGILSDIHLGTSFNDVKATAMQNMFCELPHMHYLDLTNLNTSKASNMTYMLNGAQNLTSVKFGPNFDTRKALSSNGIYSFFGTNVLNKISIASPNTKFNSSSKSYNTLPYDWYQLKNFDNINDYQSPINKQNLFDGNSHVGAWTKNSPYVSNTIKFHDIYGNIDGLTAPTNQTVNLSPTATNYTLNQSNVPSNSALTNNQTPFGWALVDNNGQIINNENANINTANHTVIYNVAPVYYGLTYKYDKVHQAVEFIDGRITWNGDNSDNSCTDSFIGTRGQSNNAPFVNANSVTFDNKVDTTKVTQMNNMFSWDNDLQNIDLGNNFKTSQVTDMNRMFNSDHNLQNINGLNQSDFNTSKVNDMSYMFWGDNDLSRLDFGKNFITPTTNDGGMFSSDYSLNIITIQSPQTLFSNAGFPSDTWHKISNPNDANSASKPYQDINIDDGQAHIGDWTKGSMERTDKIIYKDIYSDIDGMGNNVPSPTTITGMLNSNKRVTLNSDNWSLVNNQGNIINSDNETIDSNNHTVLVAPKYKGMTYKYNKNNKSLEFTNGQLDWNYNYSSVFLGTWVGTYYGPKYINQSDIKSVKFDSDVDTSKVHNFSWFIGSDSYINSINLGNKFNTINASDIQNFIADMPNITSLDLSSPYFNTANAKDDNNMYYMFGGDSNLHSIKLGTGFNISHSNANASYIFSSDNKLSDIEIMSPNTKFNNNSGLSDTWHQITDFNNPNSVKIPINVANLNDGNSHVGIWKKGNITYTTKANYVDQNNNVVGSDKISSVNGVFTWPTNVPQGYFIDGGQELSHVIQTSDIDDNGKLDKGDFNPDGSHNIYVTGDKANLHVYYKDGNQIISDYHLNGTNSIDDTTKLKNAPIGYHFNNPSQQTYHFSANKPNNVTKYSDSSIPLFVGNGKQQIAQMNDDNVKVTGNLATVYVHYVDSDNHEIFSYAESADPSDTSSSDKIGHTISLDALPTSLQGKYTILGDVSNGQPQYTFKASNINPNDEASAKGEPYDRMNDYTVHVHKIVQPAQMKLIYINQNNQQVGSPDVISGSLGQHITDLTNSDDGGESVPQGYQLVHNPNQLVSDVLVNTNKTRYLHVVGKDVNSKITVHRFVQQSDNSYVDNPETTTVSDLISWHQPNHLSTINGNTYQIKATNCQPDNSTPENSQNSIQSVVVNNNSANPNSITFYYRHNSSVRAPLIIRYVNQTGQIVGSQPMINQINVNNNPDYNVNIQNLAQNNVPSGYTTNGTSNNWHYTLTDSPQTVYVNVKGISTNPTFIVNRVERHLNGKVTISDETLHLNGDVGDRVLINPYQTNTGKGIVPDGYHADNDNTSFYVTLGASDSITPINSISYLYDENAKNINSDIGTVRIHYIDSDNVTNANPITGVADHEINEVSDHGKIGDSFDITPYEQDIPETAQSHDYDNFGVINTNDSVYAYNEFQPGVHDIYISVYKNPSNGKYLLL